ncbi:hypothetical protein N658DRAFT_294081 [Parathielavia hyrcaniae]|uniref:Uncharacterized protein n=1 Tax=Parathielavia hyrcaniae TaxID=113614 RepID=A0AAN6SY56_9PEZI|nr:hypothetical protein N658DRAFT_294081 [Parathielavia hyrcaniae]
MNISCCHLGFQYLQSSLGCTLADPPAPRRPATCLSNWQSLGYVDAYWYYAVPNQRPLSSGVSARHHMISLKSCFSVGEETRESCKRASSTTSQSPLDRTSRHLWSLLNNLKSGNKVIMAPTSDKELVRQSAVLIGVTGTLCLVAFCSSKTKRCTIPIDECVSTLAGAGFASNSHSLCNRTVVVKGLCD